MSSPPVTVAVIATGASRPPTAALVWSGMLGALGSLVVLGSGVALWAGVQLAGAVAAVFGHPGEDTSAEILAGTAGWAAVTLAVSLGLGWLLGRSVLLPAWLVGLVAGVVGTVAGLGGMGLLG